MKKIILMIVLGVPMFSFAQNKDLGENPEKQGRTFSPTFKTGFFGLTFEQYKNEDRKREKTIKILTISANANLGFYGISIETGDKHRAGGSNIFNFNYGTMVVSHGGVDYRGNGYSIEGGGRIYFNKEVEYEKLYLEGLSSYARLKFTDANYHGIHDYFTPLNMSLGYKFVLGKNLVIDPSIGVIWKIEIMSRGIIDNKDFSNWLPKAGVKIGYKF